MESKNYKLSRVSKIYPFVILQHQRTMKVTIEDKVIYFYDIHYYAGNEFLVGKYEIQQNNYLQSAITINLN